MIKGPYNARLQKGGALLEDMRALVSHWSNEPAELLREKAVSDNYLGKQTRARAADTISRVFIPRFVSGDPPDAWKRLQALENKGAAPEVVIPVYYWIAARNDALLYRFVVEELYAVSRSGVPVVRVDETAEWIKGVLAEYEQEWTETVRLKMARAILAALRDFGVLQGKTRKEVAPTYLSNEAFAYIAFNLMNLGFSSEALVSHEDWRLFLMSQPLVEHAFLDAHRNGYLSYASAGSVYRIDFTAETNKEMADVVA